MMHKADVVINGKKISPGQIWIHQSKVYGPEVFIVEDVLNPDNIRVHGIILPFTLVDFLNMRMVEDVDKESPMTQNFIHREMILHNIEEPTMRVSKWIALAIAIILTCLFLYII